MSVAFSPTSPKLGRHNGCGSPAAASLRAAVCAAPVRAQPVVNSSETLIALAPTDEEPWCIVTLNNGNRIGGRRNTKGPTKHVKVLSPPLDRTERLYNHDGHVS